VPFCNSTAVQLIPPTSTQGFKQQPFPQLIGLVVFQYTKIGNHAAQINGDRPHFSQIFDYFCIMTHADIIAQINFSLQHLNVSKVILFGSYAKGTQTDDSDIDLLVVTDDNFVFESFAQKMAVKLKISKALNSLRKHADIDLIVHTKPMYEKFLLLNSGFKKEILSSGSVIYEANN